MDVDVTLLRKGRRRLGMRVVRNVVRDSENFLRDIKEKHISTEQSLSLECTALRHSLHLLTREINTKTSFFFSLSLFSLFTFIEYDVRDHSRVLYEEREMKEKKIS